MYQVNDDIPLGCVYEKDGNTKYCPMLNREDVPFCQYFEDEPEAAIGIDERPVYCPLVEIPSAQPYTEEEIQAMQDLEQAQLDKAYELGWKEGREALREETLEYVRDRFD